MKWKRETGERKRLPTNCEGGGNERMQQIREEKE